MKLTSEFAKYLFLEEVTEDRIPDVEKSLEKCDDFIWFKETFPEGMEITDESLELVAKEVDLYNLQNMAEFVFSYVGDREPDWFDDYADKWMKNPSRISEQLQDISFIEQDLLENLFDIYIPRVPGINESINYSENSQLDKKLRELEGQIHEIIKFAFLEFVKRHIVVLEKAIDIWEKESGM